MQLNKEKSKVMVFNSSNKHDFMPKLSLETGTNLDVVESYQLLGVIHQSNLKWGRNTDYICSKAYDRIWMIRRLKQLGATIDELLDVYYKQVRSVLEFSVVVWTPGLTVGQINQIERVQKTVCAIILGGCYSDYSNALSTLTITPLSERRTELCFNFAKKSFENEKYKNWFVPRTIDPASIQTRSDKTGLTPVAARTKRFMNSPLPNLTSLLNESMKQK